MLFTITHPILQKTETYAVIVLTESKLVPQYYFYYSAKYAFKNLQFQLSHHHYK